MTPEELANLTKIGGGSAVFCVALWIGGKITLALIQLVREWRAGDQQLTVKQSDLMVGMQMVLAAQDKRLERHHDQIESQQKMDEARWMNLLSVMEDIGKALNRGPS